MHTRYQSWGRYPSFEQEAIRLRWRSQPLPIPSHSSKTYLPFGNGRSYGDSCLNEGGFLLDARGLDRLINFDLQKGILQCESGVLLSEILSLSVPCGWFPPVVPGTKSVTIGGAIANDIHGKNHHRAGTFGCHVRRLELLRSDGRRLLCSPSENAAFFKATIGGMGLTGMILWAELELKRIQSPLMKVETIPFEGIDDFLELCTESDPHYEYTVAWIDCMAASVPLGRGLFIRGNHSDNDVAPLNPPRPLITVPMGLPFSLVTPIAIRVLNRIHFHRQTRARSPGYEHYEHFFFPLDAIGQWNLLYGRRGFLQYQCVIPHSDARVVLKEIFKRVLQSKLSSFLGVLKIFGDRASPGLLSFPRPGVTLALDFSYAGRSTLQLLDELDQIVQPTGGAVNPYKDARMSKLSYQRFYPRWRELEGFRDPKFSSSFWRRVTGK